MKFAGKGIRIGAALVLMSAVAVAQQPPAAAGPQPDQARIAYVLGPEDTVTIHAQNAPDLSEKPFRVDAEGEIKLPMIGRVHAGGLTIEQLEAEIVTRLKVYLVEPEVTVGITEFRSQPVSIVGAVATPGVHQLEGQKTLVEMLAIAGGLRPDAGPSVKLTRRLEFGRIPLPGAADDSTHQFSIAEVNLKSVMEAKNPEFNIAIRPHDVISVPHAEVVYVIGEVNHAGALPLNEGDSLSVLEAVSSSGGMLHTAAISHARILRPVPGEQKRAELVVDLKKIMAGQSADIPLLAGDVLVVPGSTGKHAVYRALEAAVTAGTFIASYGVYH
ncbi:MAG TPA: polysaccharide biosynthesis/export family protein [Bryobacteraceae bacterium]|nr:polysaccharide biosynthesis/export family protein [Bryobacteraceae bacterium]